MPGDIEEQKELKDLLSRTEVRTMQKDLSILREKEAEKEKEKIVSLKTEAEEKAIIDKEKAKMTSSSSSAAQVPQGGTKSGEEHKLFDSLSLRESSVREITEKAMSPADLPVPLPPQGGGSVAMSPVASSKPSLPRAIAKGEESSAKDELFNLVGEKTREMWKKEEEDKKRFMERVQTKASASNVPLLSPLPPLPAQQEELGTLIPKPPKRPPPSLKILIRTIILLVVLLVISFSYWFFFIKKTGSSPSVPVTPVSVTESTPLKEEPTVPKSLIQTSETLTLNVSDLEGIKNSLVQTINTKIENEGFIRVLIKDVPNNKFLGLKELFTSFNVKAPEGFLDKLDNDFTLFIFTSTGTNRLGFAADIKDKISFPELLTAWEQTVEKDTEGLFLALGKEKPSAISSFKTAHYNGKAFRYISFSPANFGLCWMILDGRLLFTSSGQSMMQLINELSR